MRHRGITDGLPRIKDHTIPSPSSSTSYYSASNSDSKKTGDLLGTSSGSRSIGSDSGPHLTSKNMGLLSPLSSSQHNSISSDTLSYLSNKINDGVLDNNDIIVRQNQTSSMHLKSFSSSPSSSGSSSNRLLTLPTILTLGRVFAVPVLITTFYVDGWWGTTATTIIFIAAAITDWLDGYLARKMRLSSAFGAFLDPVADKLMVAATLVLLCTRPPEVDLIVQVPCLITIPSIAIIGREITMSAVREWAASQNGKLLEAVAVNSLGKWKTASQMAALTILLAARDSSIGGFRVLVASGVYLLNISAGLAIWSLIVYMGKVWKVLLS